MTATNTVSDILEYAISREVQANILYNMMAEYASDQQSKQLCLELAAEELDHKDRLELELMKIGEVVKAKAEQFSATAEPTNPLDYISDSGKIMDMDIEELLKMAIEKEKASFRFYIDMASLVRNEESRQALLALAEEETEHRTRFELEYSRLKANRNRRQDDF